MASHEVRGNSYRAHLSLRGMREQVAALLAMVLGVGGTVAEVRDSCSCAERGDWLVRV